MSGYRDYGEEFVEHQRKLRHLKSNVNTRAKSAVSELLNRSNIAGRSGGGRHSISGRDSCPAQKSNSILEVTSSSIASTRQQRKDASWYYVRPNQQAASEEDSASDGEPDNCSSYSSIRENNRSVPAYDIDPQTIYYLGCIHLNPEWTHNIIFNHPPPNEYFRLEPIEQAAFLYYRSLYGKYHRSVNEFQTIFRREFYNHKSKGIDDLAAYIKICSQIKQEYNQAVARRNQRAAELVLARSQIITDKEFGPGLSDDRASDKPSDVDVETASTNSSIREPPFFRIPHAPIRFAVGGRLVHINPESSVSTVYIDDVKKFCHNQKVSQQIELLESFKGPYIANETQTKTPLLFVECQINRILNSDVYQGNPSSGDANDCLLIWRLLQLLIQQQGKVTGHDLARLLTTNMGKILPKTSDFLKNSNSFTSARSSDSVDSPHHKEVGHNRAMDRLTRYLILGYVEEAIEKAIEDGLHFYALFLAIKMFKDDKAKLEELESKLLAYWKPQNHPTMSLIRVASELPFQLHSNASDDANWWKPHVAILLANLNSQTAMQVIYQLAIELAKKEFNAAADFCFLAINLLTGFDCFRSPAVVEEEENSPKVRQYISLISASLPDDETHSAITQFGWSLLDYQATEIYDYATSLAFGSGVTPISQSLVYQGCRLQYAQMLFEYGGFNHSVAHYCVKITYAIWRQIESIPTDMLMDLYDLSDLISCDSGHSAADLNLIKQHFVQILSSRNVVPAISYFPARMHNQNVVATRTTKQAPVYTVNQLSQSSESQLTTEQRHQHKAIPRTEHQQSTTNLHDVEPQPRLQELSVPQAISLPQQINQPQASVQQKMSVPQVSVPLVTSDQNPNNEHQIANESQFRADTPILSDDRQTMIPLVTSSDMSNEFYQGKSTKDIKRLSTDFVPQPQPTTNESYEPLTSYFQRANSIGEPMNEPVSSSQSETLPSKSETLQASKQGNTGFFGTFKKTLQQKIIRVMPDPTTMKLPDDSRIPEDQKIRWDEGKQRYDGASEEIVPPPPPIPSGPPLPIPGGGAETIANPAATTRKARYVNVW